MNPYFVALNGQQQGPLSFDQLQAMLKAGQLKVSDLCWREGMPDWQSISTAIPSLQMNDNSAAINPYAPPKSQWEVPAPQGMRSYYGGIGRLAYVGISIVLAITNGFLTTMNDAAAGFAIVILLVLASLATVYQRLKNIGMNPWWCLLTVVPIANLFIAFRCLACQEGYADTGRLDTAGRIVAWIFGILILLMFLSIFVSLTGAF